MRMDNFCFTALLAFACPPPFPILAPISNVDGRGGRVAVEASRGNGIRESLDPYPRQAPRPNHGAGATGSARPAVRPSYSPEAEEAAQLAQKYRDGLREVADQKKQLEARQKQLDLIFQDIRTERGAIEDLRGE